MTKIRKILTLKWVWYWTTKKYRKERKTRKEFSKIMADSFDKKKKAKLLREIGKNTSNNKDSIIVKIKEDKGKK